MKHYKRIVALFLLLLFVCFSALPLSAYAQDTSPLLLENAQRTGTFSYYVLLEDHTIVAELPVKLSRQSDTVSIVPARDLACYLSSSIDVEKDIKFVYTWEFKELRAPVKLAQKVGTVQAYLGEELLDETDLVTNYTVSKSLLSELFEYAKYIFFHPVTLLILVALIALYVLRLLRSARMASAIKAGKFVADAEADEERSQEDPPHNA